MTTPGSWYDEEAGPVVRPYAMTRGRTRTDTAHLELEAIVIASGRRPPTERPLEPEHERILALCVRPLSVAELAAHLDLPLGVIRVLVGDLVASDLLLLRRPTPTKGVIIDENLLEAVIDGLHRH